MKNIQTLLLAGCLALAGVCRAQSDTYAVIDLSGGWTAPSYPVSYLADVPAGGWTADHKTNSLVLRKIVESPSSYYYIGVFEVTKGQWERVTGVPFTPSDFPITGRSLTTIQNTFIDTLTVKTGILVAFPSEAQWEFACRAGTATLYHYGSDDPAALPGYAWFNDNSGSAPHAVGLKQASPWGLYDLYGNVEEVCLGSPIPLRGGHYSSGSLNCTSSSRVEKPEVADATSGFRISARLPKLTVNGGTGAGNYLNGTSVPVAANVVPHQTFVTWLVDPAAADLGAGFVAADAATTVTMPFHDVTLTVSNTPVLYTLAVTNGTGSGSAYTNGQTVAITANPTNIFFEFDGWVGDTATVAEITNASTTVTIPGTNIAVTATYRDKRFSLTVNYASGSGNYTNGQVVTIGASTTPPTPLHEFDHWTGDTATVADLNSAPTTFTMGPADKTLTAVFRPVAVPQKTYMIVDLTNNVVSYLDAPPPGGWTDVYKTTQMVFRKIPAGGFTMGSPASETGRDLDETQHAVTLTKDFYIGVFEVTQKQWQQVMGSTPGYFTGDTLPVEQVSYETIRGATAEANWPTMTTVGNGSFVDAIRGKAGLGTADLPTEAQWEFACRAGTTGAYAGDLDAMAWYIANSGDATHTVGTKAPNAWGLYDMHGNVFEICLDWYEGDLGSSAQVDPVGWPFSTAYRRVMRGGSYQRDAARCRSAYRGNLAVTNETLVVTNILPWAGLRLAVPQTLTAASYLLTVVNGIVNTGGYFTAGTQIGLTAAPAPAGMKFGIWQAVPAGLDLGIGFAAGSASTLLTMPAASVTVTAVYIPESSPGIYRFIQNNPGGTVERLELAGATFAITAPAPATGERFNGWLVSPAGADLGAGFNPASVVTSVVMPAHDVTVTPDYVPDLPDYPDALTPTKGVLFTLDAGEGQRPATFSASGLPLGLRIDRTTGVISGVPRRPGTYLVEVTARHPDGTSVCYGLTFSVQDLAADAQGTFTGYVYNEGGGLLQVKGLMTLTASSLGKLSAKVTMQTYAFSFSGKSWTEVTTGGLYRVTLTTRQGEVLRLEVDGADGSLTGTLTGGKLGSELFAVAGQRNAFADPTDLPAQALLSAYKGYYTVALPVEDCVTDPAVGNEQSGSGYLTVTIRERGAVKIAGKMADGTSVSASVTLLADEAGAYVPLFVRLYSKRGLFAGLLRFTGGSAPAEQQVDDHAGVLLEWLYPGRSLALTADRFDARLSAFGAYYNALANLQINYAGTFFEAEGFAWALPLIPGSLGSMTVAAGPGNPNEVKLKTVQRSGLFSGSLKMQPESTSTVKHLGVLTRNGGVNVGDGAYVQKRAVNGYTLKSSYRVWIGAE